MTNDKASCTISIIPGTNIIKSEPYGKWTAADARKNREDIKNLAKKFKGQKWGFLALVLNMAPMLDAETSKEFSKFHDEFEKEGCIAIAFIVGRKVAIKAQAQRHHDTSTSKELAVEHFHDEDEALEWLKTFNL